MPGRDHTGPMGRGSMTGKGLGICRNSKAQELSSGSRGIGQGFGRGFFCRKGFTGRGFGFAPLSQLSREETLLEEKERLQQELMLINQELEEKSKQE